MSFNILEICKFWMLSVDFLFCKPKRKDEMGVIREMRAKVGDFIHQWDLDNPDSIKNAETMFNTLKAKGFTFFEFNSKDQSKGNLVRDFDAKLEEVIAVPQKAGG